VDCPRLIVRAVLASKICNDFGRAFCRSDDPSYAFTMEGFARVGGVVLGLASCTMLACAHRSVDRSLEDWHAMLRVGATSELVVESPRARDPNANHPQPAARLWVAVDGPVERSLAIGDAWRVHYVEKTDRVSYVSEDVAGSAVLFEGEQGGTYLYLEFNTYNPDIDLDNVGSRGFDGALPVVVERLEPASLEHDDAPRPRQAYSIPPPMPPDWQGAPVPTFALALPLGCPERYVSKGIVPRLPAIATRESKATHWRLSGVAFCWVRTRRP